jgi:hypothetical protein
MGETAAVEVTLRRHSLWRGAIFLLTACTVAALVAWGLQASRAQNDAVVWLGSVLALAALGAGGSLWRVPAATLKFDGSTWWLSDPGDRRGEPTAGHLEVSLDLGVWMLLRFIPAASPGAWMRTRWLPVQFEGADVLRHALRCAIYSSRPAATDVIARGE